MPRKKKVDKETTAEQPNIGRLLLLGLSNFLSARKPKQSRAREHFRKAEVEFLKAVKGLLEHQIERIERRSDEAKRGRVRKIEVQ